MFGGVSPIMVYGGDEKEYCITLAKGFKIVMAILVMYLVIFFVLGADSDRKSVVRIDPLDKIVDNVMA